MPDIFTSFFFLNAVTHVVLTKVYNQLLYPFCRWGLGAQLLPLTFRKKESEINMLPLIQTAVGVQSKHYPKEGKCSHRTGPGGRLPPTICDGGHDPLLLLLLCKCSYPWNEVRRVIPPIGESWEPCMRNALEQSLACDKCLSSLSDTPPGIMKMLHELAALGRGLEDWVTESKGDYVNFRLTKNPQKFYVESSWCGWMALMRCSGYLLILLICVREETLTAILSTVSFFFLRPREALILWALGACDLTCAFTDVPSSCTRSVMVLVINTEGLTQNRKGWRGGEGQRHHGGAIYRALFTYSLELHTHTRKRNSGLAFLHLSLFLCPQGMSLLIVP